MSEVAKPDQSSAEEIAELKSQIERLETTNRQMQDRVRLKEQLLACLPLKIFIKDLESRFQLVNASFSAELGCTPNQMIGKTDFDFCPPDLAEKYRFDDQRVIRSGRATTLIERHIAQGRESFVEVTKAPFFDETDRLVGVIGFFGDVTERVQAEKALEQERHLLHTLMDNIPDSIYFKDAESRFTRINRSMALRFKLESPDQAIGKTDADFFDPDYARQSRLDEEEIFRLGLPIVGKEEREVWPGGETGWMLTTKMPLRDRLGNIIGTFGVSRDITRRKKSEQELQANRQLLAGILENSPAMIHVKDTTGRYILLNRRYEELFHIDGKQVLGKTVDDIFPAAEARTYTANDKKILDTGVPLEFEETADLEDGRHTYLSLKFPLFDAAGRPTHVGGISTDITERKRAEEIISRSESQFRGVWNNAFDGMRLTDQAGNIVQVNAAFCRMVGKSRAELEGHPFTAMYAEGKGEMLERHLDRFRRRSIAANLQRELTLWDGKRVWFEVTNSFIDPDGDSPKLISVFRDITDRKRAEGALQKQAALLAEQAEELERRNQEVIKAYAELKDAESQLIHSEKMAAIGQLVAGLAHEVNNPAAFVLTNLTVIARDVEDVVEYLHACREFESSMAATGASMAAARLAEIREERSVDEAAEEIMSLVESAKKGMIRIRDLVANLRSYSRIDTRTEYEMADLRQGLQATLTMLKPAIGKKIAVELDLPELLPAIECNMGQVNQVLMNLIVNAVQAVGENGRVVISAGRSKDGLLVKVKDNGPGIPAALRSRIFDPFFTTKEVGKGTGLGLSISRKIIEAHSGVIEFTSEEGKGTEFRVWLPMRQTPLPVETSSAEFSLPEISLASLADAAP